MNRNLILLTVLGLVTMIGIAEAQNFASSNSFSDGNGVAQTTSQTNGNAVAEGAASNNGIGVTSNAAGNDAFVSAQTNPQGNTVNTKAGNQGENASGVTPQAASSNSGTGFASGTAGGMVNAGSGNVGALGNFNTGAAAANAAANSQANQTLAPNSVTFNGTLFLCSLLCDNFTNFDCASCNLAQNANTSGIFNFADALVESVCLFQFVVSQASIVALNQLNPANQSVVTGIYWPGCNEIEEFVQLLNSLNLTITNLTTNSTGASIVANASAQT